MIIQRRNFLIGLGVALAAPAIVKAKSLMKVRSIPINGGWITEYYNNRVIRTWIDIESIRDKNILLRPAIPQAAWRMFNQGVPYAKSPIEDLTFVHVTRG